MQETPREKWGGILGLVLVMIPTLAVSGFEPELGRVLPAPVWVVLAALGGAIGGAIATPRTSRGAISGAAMGFGFVLLTAVYVYVRTSLSGGHTFYKIELALAGVVGAAPGAVLFGKWARGTAQR
jgi:hypothetical protein